MENSKRVVQITITFLLVATLILLTFLISQYLRKSIEITQLGDTIGGMVGPLIAIIGTLIVYISFKEQVRANELQTNSVIATIKETQNERVFNGLLLIVENRIMLINNQTFKFAAIESKLEFKEVNVKIRDLFKSVSYPEQLNSSTKKEIMSSDEYRLFGYFEYYHRNLFRIVERTIPEKSIEKDLLMNLIWENFSPTWDAVIFYVYNVLINTEEEKLDEFEKKITKYTLWWNTYFFSCFSNNNEKSLNIEMTKSTIDLLELILKRKQEGSAI